MFFPAPDLHFAARDDVELIAGVVLANDFASRFKGLRGEERGEFGQNGFGELLEDRHRAQALGVDVDMPAIG